MGTLANGIKEVFATAKTTGTNVMMCGNDGTPDGHITMANLASVIGAEGMTVLSGANRDPDTIIKAGAYQCTTWDTTKTPASSGVLYLPYWKDGFWRFEYFVGSTNGQLFYRRGTSSAWQSWTQIYDTTLLTNQTILTPLASALGVPNQVPLHTIGDCNAVPMGFGVYHTTSGSTIQNIPQGAGNSITLYSVTMKVDGSNYRGSQLLLDVSNNHLYQRGYSGSWSTWRTLI